MSQNASSGEQSEGIEQAQPTLCAACCRYFSNPGCNGMCSSCFRDFLRKQGKNDAEKTDPPRSPHPRSPSQSTPPPEQVQIEKPSPPPAIPSSQSPIPSLQEKDEKDEKAERLLSGKDLFSTGDSKSAVAKLDAVNNPTEVFKRPRRTRCFFCRQKVGLLAFSCRCGGQFCETHRYPESHDCDFDHKKAQRKKIQEENPVIRGDKLEKV